MPSLRHRAAFLWAERSLLTDLDSIRRRLSAHLGCPVRLERYICGRGWGLKYVVRTELNGPPTVLAKIASRTIERRLQRAQGGNYLPPEERYCQEAGVIQALAREGLGPELLDSGPAWFARSFMAGRCFQDLPPEELATTLPAVLAAVDRAAAAGIFHTDMNSNNVIIDPDSGQVGFIDSEWPQAGPLAGLDRSAVRRYCHRRLLFTLGRDYPAAAEARFRERLLGIAFAHYSATKGPLSLEETAILLSGRGFTAWSVE